MKSQADLHISEVANIVLEVVYVKRDFHCQRRTANIMSTHTFVGEKFVLFSG